MIKVGPGQTSNLLIRSQSSVSGPYRGICTCRSGSISCPIWTPESGAVLPVCETDV
jgi:hypothetical protein